MTTIYILTKYAASTPFGQFDSEKTNCHSEYIGEWNGDKSQESLGRFVFSHVDVAGHARSKGNLVNH